MCGLGGIQCLAYSWHSSSVRGSVDLNTLCPTPRPLAGRCLPCKDMGLASRAVTISYGNSTVGTVGKARGACAHCQGSISVTEALTSSDLVFSPLTNRLPATAKLGDDLHWPPEKGLTPSPLIPTPTTSPAPPPWLGVLFPPPVSPTASGLAWPLLRPHAQHRARHTGGTWEMFPMGNVSRVNE